MFQWNRRRCRVVQFVSELDKNARFNALGHRYSQDPKASTHSCVGEESDVHIAYNLTVNGCLQRSAVPFVRYRIPAGMPLQYNAEYYTTVH